MALWALMMLELWHRRFVDDAGARQRVSESAAQLTPAIA
jgi:hypothetical protein